MLKIDYKFKDESLLRLAMTHSSYANEHHGTHLQCNERLEFLGDSILGAIVADVAFERFHEPDEGGVTRIKVALVSGASLSDVASGLGLAHLIVLGSSETGQRPGAHPSALNTVNEG